MTEKRRIGCVCSGVCVGVALCGCVCERVCVSVCVCLCPVFLVCVCVCMCMLVCISISVFCSHVGALFSLSSLRPSRSMGTLHRDERERGGGREREGEGI